MHGPSSRKLVSAWKNTFASNAHKKGGKGIFDSDAYYDYGRTQVKSVGLSSTAVSKSFSSIQRTSYRPFSLTGEKKKKKM